MSWEEELEEGPGDHKEESDVLNDTPEKSKMSFRELEESFCSDVQSFGDASSDLKVDCKEEQGDRWLTQDEVNGAVDEFKESLDMGTMIEEKPVETKTQADNKEERTEAIEEHHPEHSETKHEPFQEATTERIISSESVHVEERSEKTEDEVKVDCPSPSVSPTVALFQQQVSQSKFSADSVPSTSFRGQDSSRGTALRSHNIHSASRRSATDTDELSSRSLPIQLSDEEQNKTPIKVSELKKRFEH